MPSRSHEGRLSALGTFMEDHPLVVTIVIIAAVILLRMGALLFFSLPDRHSVGWEGLLSQGAVSLCGTAAGALLVWVGVRIVADEGNRLRKLEGLERDAFFDENVLEGKVLVLNVVVYCGLGAVALISLLAFVEGIVTYGEYREPLALVVLALMGAAAITGIVRYVRWRRGHPTKFENLVSILLVSAVFLGAGLLLYFQGSTLSRVARDVVNGPRSDICVVAGVTESTSSNSPTRYTVRLVSQGTGEVSQVSFSTDAQGVLPSAIVTEGDTVWAEWYPETGVMVAARAV